MPTEVLMNVGTARTLVAFAAVLAGVFAVAWVVGDSVGPEPPRDHPSGSMGAHR